MAPILVVLVLMIWRRWGAHRAGVAGWLVGLVVGTIWFGITPSLVWVSQAKALLLAGFVLAVMWPALLLYHWIDQNGGIVATAEALERSVPNRGMCLVLMAWALSGLLEGLAGFGLPIAVVAPMLVSLKVEPLRAVTAVAIGHSWSVTFGDMGVILQVLTAVVSIPTAELVPWAGLFLGAACLFCGLLTAHILGHAREWPKIVALSLVMGIVQYVLAALGLSALAALGAGAAGLASYVGAARLLRRRPPQVAEPAPNAAAVTMPLTLSLACYGGLTLLLALTTMVPPVKEVARAVQWKAEFPTVVSTSGFATPASSSQLIQPFAHPGTLILIVTLAGMCWTGGNGIAQVRRAAAATFKSAGLASVGILFMVGLSVLMEYCGMSYLLAQGLCNALGAAYPIVSPLVGILGAFATGSNNNSNVLFGMLQKNVAMLLNTNPSIIVAAQTAGGSLGSMLSPAKIIVGCSTVGEVGREGQVLKVTVPWGLLFGLVVGLLAFLLGAARLR